MDIASWFRRSLSVTKPKEVDQSKHLNQKQEEEEEEEEEEVLGVTEKLIEFIKSFTLETFQNFPLQEEEEEESYSVDGVDSPTTSDNVRKDLSEWQERHAILVLSKVKEMSQLRYKLCPRHFKERQFWRIYFLLVKSYVAEYELRAIRLAKLKRMAVGHGNSSNKSGYEVEMAEAKQATTAAPPTP